MRALVKKIASRLGQVADWCDRAALALDPPGPDHAALDLRRLTAGFAALGLFVVFVFAVLMLSETGHGR